MYWWGVLEFPLDRIVVHHRLSPWILLGFPLVFCEVFLQYFVMGAPPGIFSRYPTALSQVSLKHLSGFPAAFCQVSPQYLGKGPLSISSRHPAFWLVFHRHFLQAFPWHFLRFPWQIATTHLHSWVKIEALRGQVNFQNLPSLQSIKAQNANSSRICQTRVFRQTVLYLHSDTCLPSWQSTCSWVKPWRTTWSRKIKAWPVWDAGTSRTWRTGERQKIRSL